MADQPELIYVAAAIVDTALGLARPGAVAVRNGRIVASGPTGQVRDTVDRWENVVRLDDALILPGMVNAHVHLDLTGIGPQPFDDDFPRWLGTVTEARPVGADAIARTVTDAVDQCRDAGVGGVGDIAYDPAAVSARCQTQLPGVSFLECFGPGRFARDGIDKLNDRLSALPLTQDQVRVGISPHAPYTADRAVYDHVTALCCQHGYPLTTHLAESPQEEQFTRRATGMFVEHLQRMNWWDDAITPTGLHPVEWLEPCLQRARWLVAHCNYVDDDHIDTLARCGATVAYCPVASDYFGHRGHRYRDMLAGGVNVCLGTDSIVCQPADEPQPLGLLAQMRHLYRRDRTEPAQLLAMATVNGCKALGLAAHHATLQAGAPARLYSVRFDPTDRRDPLTQVLENRYPVQPLKIAENML